MDSSREISSSQKSNAQVIGETVVKVAAVGAAAVVGKMAVDAVKENPDVISDVIEGVLDFLFD